jgi:hypothetical protein
MTSPQKTSKTDQFLFVVALGLVLYMPMHVFLSQSLSLVTGGLEIWKATKDVLITLSVPFLLYIAYKRRLFSSAYKLHFVLGTLYVLLHLFFVIFSTSDDTYSAIVGAVYNNRLLAYLLLGMLVGSSKRGREYLQKLSVAVVIVASIVALFGIAQYFLPHNMLENVGYSVERGVKPMFFIDDKPDFPRVMSTLRDPNSLGAYLILPLMMVTLALIKKGANEALFWRPYRREVLIGIGAVLFGALFLTFSRGALLASILSLVTILSIVTGQRMLAFSRKYWIYFLGLIVILAGIIGLSWNTYTFQNLVFHADQSTVLADPNELRVSLTQEAIDEVAETPLGHGPGTAGLVSITNPKGGVLTENYYLQIAYEVGWLGVVLFIAIFFIIMYQLFTTARKSPFASVLFASGIGYTFYALLIHLWSNEAIALQWWLLAGISLSVLQSLPKKHAL